MARADDERRERLLAGAAARAAGVLLEPAPAGHADARAAARALLAVRQPLRDEPALFVIDDLHWADAPSLRFLEFLGRRLDGLAIAGRRRHARRTSRASSASC